MDIRSSLEKIDQLLLKMNEKKSRPTRPWKAGPRNSIGQIGCIHRGDGVMCMTIQEMMSTDGKIRVLKDKMSHEETIAFLETL